MKLSCLGTMNVAKLSLSNWFYTVAACIVSRRIQCMIPVEILFVILYKIVALHQNKKFFAMHESSYLNNNYTIKCLKTLLLKLIALFLDF